MNKNPDIANVLPQNSALCSAIQRPSFINANAFVDSVGLKSGVLRRKQETAHKMAQRVKVMQLS